MNLSVIQNRVLHTPRWPDVGDNGRNLKSFFAPLGLQQVGPTQKAK